MSNVWARIKWVFGTAGFWIVSIAGFLFGYVYYLLTKNQTLKDKNLILENKESQRLWWNSVKEKTDAANKDVVDYQRARDEYLKSTKGDGSA